MKLLPGSIRQYVPFATPKSAQFQLHGVICAPCDAWMTLIITIDECNTVRKTTTFNITYFLLHLVALVMY